MHLLDCAESLGARIRSRSLRAVGRAGVVVGEGVVDWIVWSPSYVCVYKRNGMLQMIERIWTSEEEAE
jgi:hypothetical protein